MATIVKIKSIYEPTEYGPESNLKFEKTLTQQQFKDEQNINNIMRKYGAAAFSSQTQYLQQGFADFSKPVDFLTAKTLIVQAENHFNELPAELRKEFDNNPVNLVNFVKDEKNREKAIKLGLLDPEKIKKPEPSAPIVPPKAEPVG